MASSRTSAEIHAELGHPVIDCDGHYLEFEAVVADYVADVGGPTMADRFLATRSRANRPAGYFLDPSSPQARRERGDPGFPVFWARPARNTLDRATGHLPQLMYERLPEFGLDFSIQFPSGGLRLPHTVDDEERRAFCRGFNAFLADTYAPFASRMTPAAVIPLHTPEEGIAQLEHAVRTLGLKVAMIPTYVRRPVTALLSTSVNLAYQAGTFDFYGLDSEYDYDPFWAKCVELDVVPCTHSTGMGWGSRRSYTNFMYNHVGHFVAASEALCKSLVLGGVTRRFPQLRVAFLECGVGWACSLYADLIAHWEKRNPAMLADLDPQAVDVQQMMQLLEEHGNDRMVAKAAVIRDTFGVAEMRPPVDDWAATGVETAADFRALFEPHFYFGCEADDPMNAWAFNAEVNPHGARLRPLLSSDVSHWDVVNMTDVLREAYELVERGVITETDFRDFSFTNPVSAFGINPEFFTGTECEQAVRRG